MFTDDGAGEELSLRVGGTTTVSDETKEGLGQRRGRVMRSAEQRAADQLCISDAGPGCWCLSVCGVEVVYGTEDALDRLAKRIRSKLTEAFRDALAADALQDEPNPAIRPGRRER